MMKQQPHLMGPPTLVLSPLFQEPQVSQEVIMLCLALGQSEQAVAGGRYSPFLPLASSRVKRQRLLSGDPIKI